MTTEEDLSQAIALATAWAAGEVETWTVLAHEAITGDPAKVLRQMSFIIAHLAETVAEHTGGSWSAATVLQQMALDAAADGDDESEQE